MNHGPRNQSQNQAMNEALIIAACIAMYTTAEELKHELEDWRELQQQAADDFCDLIELNANEFAKLGLTLN